MTEVYGISSFYDYFELSLDSQDASYSYSGTQSKLNWPVFDIGGGLQSLQNVVALKVISASIPFSYYVFTSQNNTFQLFELGPNATPSTITITPGNYTFSDMITELELRMSLTNSPNGCTYTIVFNQSTNKFTFTSDGLAGTTAFNLVFDLTSDNTCPKWFLGFNSGNNQSTLLDLTSSNVCLLSGPNYLYVNSQKYGQLTNNVLPNGSLNTGGNRGPQLTRIPINASPGDVIEFVDPNPNMFFSIGTSNSLQEIDLYLTLGNFSTLMDFNGLSFAIQLGILVQRESSSASGTGGLQSGRVAKRSRPI